MTQPSATSTPEESRARGRYAERPADFSAKAWRDVLLRVKREVSDDQLSLLSAGVAFYGLLALFPGLAVLVSLFAWFADPSEVASTIDGLRLVPEAVRNVIYRQLEELGRVSDTTKGVSLFAGTLVSIWSASKALRAMIAAMNTAYDEEETRGWLHRMLVVLFFTTVSLVAGSAALLVITVLPAYLERNGVTVLALALPWVVTLVAFTGWLAVLYRYGPSRSDAQWRWITPGSITASILWLVASLTFSAYVANFGRYNETYGSMGATVVLLLWFWVSAWTVLFGAELNAEMEHQTAEDSTTGERQPRGHRGAYVADHLGDVPDEN